MRPQVVGRLAPSPTGALHLGNARTFLLAWLSTRRQRGQLQLRVEDIDSPRVKPWAVASALEDLRWLGLDWDVGPDEPSAPLAPVDSGTSHEPLASGAPRDRIASTVDTRAAIPAAIPGAEELIQSRRLPRYREVLERLIAQGRVYPCTCTRSEIARAASAPHEQLGGLEGPIYPGTCRDRSLDPGALEGRRFAWRWRFTPDALQWTDGLHGVMRARPADQLGDFVIAKGDGTPAYQLAVVVDDHDFGVNEVVRGDDLIFSTFRQRALADHLGWPAPVYYHVPLMVGPDGKRLAKRHGDTRLGFFRHRRVAPEAIVGYLAWTLRLIDDLQPISPRRLIERFDWGRIPAGPTPFHVIEELPKLRRLSGLE